MPRLPYSIVDVFSSVPYQGNPLAVVDNTTDSLTLTKTQMQLIARQFNLSETTFICPPTKPGSTYRLRSFLPNGEEVFGAGHNSLGAWWHIADSRLVELRDTESTVFHQELGDSVLPVAVFRSAQGEILITMSQGAPQLLERHPDKSTLAQALGIDSSDIGFEYNAKSMAQPQVVTTSPARHLLVPIRDQETLSGIDFSNSDAIARELAKTNSHNSGVYAFTPVGETDGVLNLEARFFSPGMGMEDPATGSAAGPLAFFLCGNGLVHAVSEGNVEVQVVQGLKKGRECVMRLLVRRDVKTDSLKIQISGTGVLVSEGTLVVPSPDISF
jgi:PhzF family phenazine biosynthesis protein